MQYSLMIPRFQRQENMCFSDNQASLHARICLAHMTKCQSSALLILMEQRCVHCLEGLDKPTKDHVFPRAWYPDNTPENVQRWTVPCCSDCNGKFGSLEKKLFTRLALCIDPGKAEASGISKKVMGGLGVGVLGIKDEEKSHRQAQLAALIKKTARYKEGMDTFPGFGLHEGFPENEQTALLIAEELLIQVAEKILRGCEYKLGAGRYIEAPYQLEVRFPQGGFSRYGRD